MPVSSTHAFSRSYSSKQTSAPINYFSANAVGMQRAAVSGEERPRLQAELGKVHPHLFPPKVLTCLILLKTAEKTFTQ
ncbi:hypothetical protein LEMLEM_LOCUS4339 [Lemmus lemmus]